MKAEQIIVPTGIAVIVGALFWYLRGTGNPMNVVYPNTQASGVPAYAAPATVFNMGNTIPAPSPNLVYGPALPLPATPSYQSYNSSPINLYGLTPEAAAGAVPNAKKDTCGSCCDCGCSDGNCAKYGDGNNGICLAASRAEQIKNSSPKQVADLAANIGSASFLNDGFFWQEIAKNQSALQVMQSGGHGAGG